MSGVKCRVSGVVHKKIILLKNIYKRNLDKVVELVGGGSVFNGSTLSSFTQCPWARLKYWGQKEGDTGSLKQDSVSRLSGNKGTACTKKNSVKLKYKKENFQLITHLSFPARHQIRFIHLKVSSNYMPLYSLLHYVELLLTYIEVWASTLKSGFNYLKSSFLEKLNFFLKIWQEKWQNKANIYIRQFAQIGVFEDKDLKQGIIQK